MNGSESDSVFGQTIAVTNENFYCPAPALESPASPSTGWSGYGSIGQYQLRVSRLLTPGVATTLALAQDPDNGLKLSWAAPSTSGGGTTSYEAKVCLGAGQLQCTAPVTTGSMSATFPSLVPGQSNRGCERPRRTAVVGLRLECTAFRR